jgi:phosphocarrier protein FPr
MPIEQVPDPVFSQKMVGDGISVDPLNQTLVAPCDGEVIQLHGAHHAVTIATAGGIEVMMHIGLDTVDLKGQGFTPKVNVGDRVRTGDVLIEFDADFVATHAKSLLTQVVITNSDQVAAFAPRSGSVRAGEDVILELTLAGGTAAAEETVQPSQAVRSEPITVPNPTGLHARPAAVLANQAKKFQSDVRVRRGDAEANAKSVVGIMKLEIGRGDQITLEAQGADANDAIATLTELIRQGLGEDGAQPVPAPASRAVPAATKPTPQRRSTDPNLVLGVSASPGLAVGKVFQLRHTDIQVAEQGGDPQAERRALDEALAQARVQLQALQGRLRGQADADKAAIFAAHEELLSDPELLDLAASTITNGKSAAWAWQQAFRSYADQLAGLQSELLAARANDVRDVGERVLRIITGAPSEDVELPPQTILVAEELTPSDTANLDRSKVLGFCTVGGGASSHVAILARAMDIPAVAGIEPQVLDLPNGTPVILDGVKGELRLNPSSAEVQRIQDMLQQQATKRKADLQTAQQPAVTLDGHRVEVVANIGKNAEAQQVVQLGGEGVGLLRSEFLFLDRATAPTEDEQAQIYTEIAQTLGPDRPLIIRTLDVGGDKPLSYLPLAKEENPFLGVRGVRVGFDQPELLRTQLRAILRASTLGNVRIMFPMIATLDEWRMAKAMLDEERAQLGAAPIPAGIMVEVPSTAVMADQFAREVDFFSVGTNDLTQYTLAMDRGHPKLAPQVDGLNPAVLQLIGNAAQAAHRHGKWIGICGGIASDPQAVPILIGLGVDELSVSAPTLPGIKAQIRELNLEACQRLAQQALQQDTAAAVRALVAEQDQSREQAEVQVIDASRVAGKHMEVGR